MKDMTLKFTGTFGNLKRLGCTFHKLYAANYKVYKKELSGGGKFWIWQHHGGYIEYEDLYSNTKDFIRCLKEIDWNEANVSERSKDYIYMHIRYSHSDPSKGCIVSKHSKSLQSFKLMNKELGDLIPERMEEYHQKVIGEYDREITIIKSDAEEILEVYEQIQNC